MDNPVNREKVQRELERLKRENGYGGRDHGLIDEEGNIWQPSRNPPPKYDWLGNIKDAL